MLSHRTLHFTRNQTYWHCAGLAVSSDNSCLDLNGQLLGDRGYYGPDMAIVSLDRAQTLKRWWNLVTDYSNRSLTFESDKPLALQGIVTMLNRHEPDQYWHGHWRRDLPLGLLWTPLNHVTESPPARIDDSFPTWSWLSHQGPVRKRRDYFSDSVILAEIVNPSWARRNGSEHSKLILNCHVLQASLRSIDPEEYFAAKLRVVAGPRVDQSSQSYALATYMLEGRLDWLGHVKEVVSGDNLVAAIPICQATYVSPPLGTSMVLRFLLVIPSNASQHEYRRIGMGEASGVHAERLMVLMSATTERQHIFLV